MINYSFARVNEKSLLHERKIFSLEGGPVVSFNFKVLIEYEILIEAFTH